MSTTTSVASANLIGILGKARSGKDSAADFMMEMLNGTSKKPKWEHVSFAAILKKSVEVLFHLPPGAANDSARRAMRLPFLDCTLAKFLQDYGQTMREKFGQDFWIKALFDQIPVGAHWIISDVRYPNEANMIKSLGGIIVKIERTHDDRPPALSMQDGRDPSHSSEALVDSIDADALIVNNKSLADLKESIRHTLMKMGLHPDSTEPGFW